MRRLILVLVVVAFAVAVLFAAGSTAMANGGRPLSAALSGANEFPFGSGDPDGSGYAELTLNQGQGEICFDISVQNIGTVILSHIHRGPAGANGPVVVDFRGQLNGCVSGIDKDLIKAIRQNPESYYVNIHTTEFRPGAVRGQLSK